MSPDEIKEKWRTDANEAANRGTWMHWQCERFLNKQLIHTDTPEMAAFMMYLSTLGGCEAFRWNCAAHWLLLHMTTRVHVPKR